MQNIEQMRAAGTTAGDAYQKTIRVKASPDVLFDALTTAAGLSAWWSRCSGSGEQGGELQFLMNAPEPLVVRVARANRPAVVEWAVTACPFMRDWVGTRPTFTITPAGQGESELHFVHHGLTSALECIDVCTRGWDHYLVSLREYAETGRGFPQGSDEDKARRHREKGA